jgi:acetyl esterase/lipase
MTHVFAALAALALACCVQAQAQEKVIRLYDGPAPGSETWKQSEQENNTNFWMTRVVFNVASPTLTVFQPEQGTANGTAVIICPGGGFFALSIDSEGNDVAKWLVKKGVTCFVLKYRLVECKTDDPTREMMARNPIDEIVKPIAKLAMDDGLASVAYIRKHAAEFGVNPKHVGIIGFSAGGTVAVSTAMNYTAENRPDFVAPIYPAVRWAVKGSGVPTDAPPAFILAASDDPLGLAPESVALYQDWMAAKKPAELHLYTKGGHGFGMRVQRLPSDHWIQLFSDWLDVQGFGRSP